MDEKVGPECEASCPRGLTLPVRLSYENNTIRVIRGHRVPQGLELATLEMEFQSVQSLKNVLIFRDT